MHRSCLKQVVTGNKWIPCDLPNGLFDTSCSCHILALSVIYYRTDAW